MVISFTGEWEEEAEVAHAAVLVVYIADLRRQLVGYQDLTTATHDHVVDECHREIGEV